MHDLMTQLATYDVTARPPRLPNADVSYAVHESALGPMVIAAAGGRVVASSFDAEDVVAEKLARRLSPRVLRQPARLDEVRRELDDFLAGHRTTFDVVVDLALAGDFQRSVLEALAASTPYGQTTTYGSLAGAIGKPRAARAVGAALGSNPCCVFVPCHRVVGAGGALTGYAGGINAKRRLLELEQQLLRSYQ